MLNALKEIVNPDVVINICSSDRTLVLKEEDPSSKIKKLFIKGVPSKSFAITLDYQPKGSKRKFFKQLSSYINTACDNGVNKSCDLVVFTDLGNGEYKVLIFDLKSDKPRVEATKKQLLNSELYVKYLITMLEGHYNIKVRKIHYKRAIVSTDPKGMRKNTSYRPNQESIGDTDYKIKTVFVDSSKVGRVNFGAL